MPVTDLLWAKFWVGTMPLLILALGIIGVTDALLQVSVFLAAFSGFYFTICAVTDEAYRDQFFTTVKRELDRAVAVRAVYLALRGHDPA